MAYCEFSPDGALSSYVRCFWTLTSDPTPADGRRRAFETLRSRWMFAADPVEGYTEQLLPDGSVEVAFHLGDPVFECPRRERPRRLPARVICGQLTRPLTLAAGGRIEAVGVRFRPAGASVFVREGMRELTDRCVPLEEFCPGMARIGDRVTAVGTFAARVLVLEDALQGLMFRGLVQPPEPMVFRAVEMLEAAAGRARIDDVAGRLGVSGRRLLRIFNRHVGISPKLLARVLRFQRVFHVLKASPHAPWSGLALEAGYYDQAHLVHEFRAFTGRTPEAFMREWRDVVDWPERHAA